MVFNVRNIRPHSELIFVDEFEVRINWKNVKRMRMHVAAPDGHVEISAPSTLFEQEVRNFVHEKRAWIKREQEKLQHSPQMQAELASDAEKRYWKQVVAATAPVLVEHWAAVLGVVPGALTYRNMRSRWGSCQPSTGRICINTRLALYPPECLEYVVVHELCHLREAGHTPRFWALVETCLPNYKHAKKLLRA